MGVHQAAEELQEAVGDDEGCDACCEEEEEEAERGPADAVATGVEETLRGEVGVGLAADHWWAGTGGGGGGGGGDGDEGGLCGVQWHCGCLLVGGRLSPVRREAVGGGKGLIGRRARAGRRSQLRRGVGLVAVAVAVRRAGSVR